MTGLVSTAQTRVDAPPELVWAALTDPAQVQQYMSGTHVESDWQPDEPASYHTLTYALDAVDGGTRVVLTQDNNASEDEVAHTGAFWQNMLDSLKKVVESH